eukprot:CAMPEP_0202922840 /NCGR_PEP_ID=MMETSP1392-20130828/78137_1 /ASSEMBLY_ACC=CAM_ASM_000868 /TAXON_ID=225041 /ORGANISM="Chlamydomonas chlamydogama, Strain SAG 11-48b" /LENGTH=92 /DNA_ID=CAMNT_0049616491 /DNA_START=3526 /DNA_END=3804 /DNA_ORIENTATION=+
MPPLFSVLRGLALRATVGKEVDSDGRTSMMMMEASSMVRRSRDTALTNAEAEAPVGLLRVSFADLLNDSTSQRPSDAIITRQPSPGRSTWRM